MRRRNFYSVSWRLVSCWVILQIRLKIFMNGARGKQHDGENNLMNNSHRQKFDQKFEFKIFFSSCCFPLELMSINNLNVFEFLTLIFCVWSIILLKQKWNLVSGWPQKMNQKVIEHNFKNSHLTSSIYVRGRVVASYF